MLKFYIKMVIIALLFGAILSIAHYLSEYFHKHRHKRELISFGAGIMLSYIILDLFPRLYLYAGIITKFIFIFVLLGFSFFYLGEKYIFQHMQTKKKLKDLREMHLLAFFMYYFIIGFLLKKVTDSNILDGLLLFLPLLFHTSFGIVSLHHVHRSKEGLILKLFLSLSPLFGIIAAYFFSPPELVFHIFLSLISGALLFIVASEIIPKERASTSIDFILGVALYSLILVSTWLI